MENYYCYLVFSNKEDGENIVQNYLNSDEELDFFKLIPITLDDVRNLDEKWGALCTQKLEYDSDFFMLSGSIKGGVPYAIFEEISKKCSKPMFCMIEGEDNYYYQSVITYNKGEKLEEKFFDLNFDNLGENVSDAEYQEVYDKLVDEKYNYGMEKLNELNNFSNEEAMQN